MWHLLTWQLSVKKKEANLLDPDPFHDQLQSVLLSLRWASVTEAHHKDIKVSLIYDRENRVSVKNDIVRSRAAGWEIAQP